VKVHHERLRRAGYLAGKKSWNVASTIYRVNISAKRAHMKSPLPASHTFQIISPKKTVHFS
jgi:spore maturation protein CgeB